MQTLLLISDDNTFIEGQINSIVKKYQISKFSVINISPQTSLGVEQVRELKENLILKPFAGQHRLIVINEFHKATVEAQNALLKLFEEPPDKTIILVVSPVLSKILPTIISRCRIITDHLRSKSEKPAVKKSYENILYLLNADTSDRLLKAAEIAKSKEESLIFLNKLLVELRNALKNISAENPLSNSQTASLIRKVQAAIKYIEANVTYKGVFDVLFLGFPQKYQE